MACFLVALLVLVLVLLPIFFSTRGTVRGEAVPICQFNDTILCSSLDAQGLCTDSISNYIAGALTLGATYPGLTECLTGICCFCSTSPYSASATCSAKTVSLGSFGYQSVSTVCMFIPAYVEGVTFDCSSFQIYTPSPSSSSTSSATGAMVVTTTSVEGYHNITTTSASPTSSSISASTASSSTATHTTTPGQTDSNGSPSKNSSSNNNSSSSTGLIVGVVVGGLVLILILVLLAVYLLRQRRSRVVRLGLPAPPHGGDERGNDALISFGNSTFQHNDLQRQPLAESESDA